jgi:hypothetical protein
MFVATRDDQVDGFILNETQERARRRHIDRADPFVGVLDAVTQQELLDVLQVMLRACLLARLAEFDDGDGLRLAQERQRIRDGAAGLFLLPDTKSLTR